MNMFYYRWLRFPQYSVVYNKQLTLTVPTVHCFSVSRHVQCIWLAQLLLNTILYLCLKMSESDQNGSFKDINALQSLQSLCISAPTAGQQIQRYKSLDDGWREDSLWRATRIGEFPRIAVMERKMLTVYKYIDLGNRPVQTVFCNPLRFIIVVVFILRCSLMNSGPLFSALIAARYVCLVITCWALLT